MSEREHPVAEIPGTRPRRDAAGRLWLNCRWCGELFSARRADARYCTEAHARKMRAWRRADRDRIRRLATHPDAMICPGCHQPFVPSRARQVCCSGRCRGRKWRQAHGARPTPARQGRPRVAARPDLDPRICPGCRLPFVPTTDLQVCCSGRCRARLWRARHTLPATVAAGEVAATGQHPTSASPVGAPLAGVAAFLAAATGQAPGPVTPPATGHTHPVAAGHVPGPATQVAAPAGRAFAGHETATPSGHPAMAAGRTATGGDR